jgi:condensin complex subunit 1
LARYTCVALQRLNGSAKKIKGGLRNLNVPIPWFHAIYIFLLGSLLDKTLRIEMDNQIFRKLQTAMENPCRTKEWFGLAEQVINTVYALGEHPDNFCDELIKNLTIRAFSRPPKAAGESVAKDPDVMNENHPADTTIDTGDVSMLDATQATQAQTTQATQDNDERDVGDAFELSQLLFVVGHVAIKQIVFLELIEREWKRQKDEKQTGWFCCSP